MLTRGPHNFSPSMASRAIQWERCLLERSPRRTQTVRWQTHSEIAMDIGFIGLGNMGKAIAARLISAGHQVRVWNRSPQPVQELVAKGARGADRPADVARADFLVTMLANDDAVRGVIIDQGVLEAATPGLVHLNLATVSVAL